MLTELFEKCVHGKYEQTGKSASYFTERLSDTLYLYFEASNGENDWRRNLDFPVKAYKRMGKTVWLAHRGFLKTWHELEDTLAPYIADERVRKVVTVGYSHGAALALLAHEYIWYSRPDLRNTSVGYGFGCPRVLWGICKSDVRRRFDNFTVIRNIDDVVTHVPPAILGYTHVGALIEVGTRGKYSRVDAHRPENILRELKEYESTKATSKPVFSFTSHKLRLGAV